MFSICLVGRFHKRKVLNIDTTYYVHTWLRHEFIYSCSTFDFLLLKAFQRANWKQPDMKSPSKNIQDFMGVVLVYLEPIAYSIGGAESSHYQTEKKTKTKQIVSHSCNVLTSYCYNIILDLHTTDNRRKGRTSCRRIAFTNSSNSWVLWKAIRYESGCN